MQSARQESGHFTADAGYGRERVEGGRQENGGRERRAMSVVFRLEGGKTGRVKARGFTRVDFLPGFQAEGKLSGLYYPVRVFSVAGGTCGCQEEMV